MCYGIVAKISKTDFLGRSSGHFSTSLCHSLVLVVFLSAFIPADYKAAQDNTSNTFPFIINF